MKQNLRKLLSLALALVMLLGLSAFAAAADDGSTVQVSPQDLYVNGTLILCDKYNIAGNNYFKLRDIAAMLDGTPCQFDIGFDEASMTVSVTIGKGYTAAGGELETGVDNSASCVESAWKVSVDGTPVNAAVYNLGGNNYFKLRDLGEAIGFGVEYDAPDNFAVITAEDGVLYTHIHDNTTGITDSFFDKYFKEGNAREGVEALLNSGNYYINNVKVPASEGETTTYNVNQVKALWKEDSGWGIQIHKTTTDTNMSFADARLQLVDTATKVRGHTTTLYTDGSGYVTRINTTNVESVLVCGINHWNEDTVFERGDFKVETNRGPHPDINELHFNTKNVDASIEVGDFAEYWYDGGDQGWHIRRALAVEGILAKAEGKFIINGTDRRVESNVSRYCLRTYNRPTQFFDAYAALDLGLQEVVVWCTATGHPIGFTLGDKADAKATLGVAIENAKAAKAGVSVSTDGKDVSGKWVAQEDMDAFDAAIAAAETVYNTNATPSYGYDQAMYELAQALGQGGNNPSGFIGAQGDGSGAASGTGSTNTGAQSKGLQQSGMEGDSYVWVNDGTTAITDARFDEYFSGTAKEGVEALLNAGAFYINGIKVPATDTETNIYNINGVQALFKGDAGWGYQVHKTTTDTNMSFADARLGFVGTVTTVRGHTTTLHLTNGVCDRIDATNIESVYVTDIINHGAQAEIKRGEFSLETNRGAHPDVETLSFNNSDGSWDDSIQIGDFAVYWYGENGWTIRRAVPVTGAVTKNDAGEFVINGNDNRIESNISRYCLRTYNRPTQFYSDAYTRLGLNELEVTVWCTSTGHPIGFACTRAQGKEALTQAVANCRAALEGVQISADGKDVEKGVMWVTQADMDEFVAAIDAAETIANRNATPLTQYDQAIYELGQAYGQGGNNPSGFIGAQGEGTK